MAKFTSKKTATTTPTPEPKAAKRGSQPAEATERSGKNIGRTTGMRIMAFQDQTMANQPDKRLTDEELAAEWQAEFPDSRCRFEDRLDVVRTVRRLFNEGKHGAQELKPPKGGVAKYELQGRNRVEVAEPKRGRAHSGVEPVAKAADTGRGKRTAA